MNPRRIVPKSIERAETEYGDFDRLAVQMGIARPCNRCGVFPQEKDSAYCGKTCSSKADAQHDDGSSSNAYVTPKSPNPPTQSRFGSRSLIAGDKRIPRPPKPYIKPRSAYQISFGEYKGEPNFLLRSKKGLAWANLPNALHRVCKGDDMADKVLDFSLGPGGKFYFLWRDGNESKMETSPGLWEDLDVDFQGGSVRQIQFGGEGTVWGIRSFRQYKTDDGSGRANDENPSRMALVEAPLDLNADGSSMRSVSTGGGSRFKAGKYDEDDEDEDYDFVQSPTSMRSSTYGGKRTPNPAQPNNELPYVVHEEPFGRIPDTLVNKTMEIYPSMQHYGQVDFVAVGMGGSWVIGVMGKLCFWDKMEGKIVEKLAKVYEEGESLRNVVIAPTSNSIYVIEAKDGMVQYRVPDEWHARIKGHLHPANALELETPRLHRPMARPWQHQSQPQPPAGPQPRSVTPRGRGRGGSLHSGGSVGGSRPNSLFVPSQPGPPGRRPSPSPPPPQSGSGFGRGGGNRPNSSHHQQQYHPPPGPPGGPPPGSYDPNAPPPYVPYQPPPNYLSANPSQVYAQNAPTSGVIQAPGVYRSPQHHHSQPTLGSNGGASANASGCGGSCSHQGCGCQQNQPVSMKREAMVAMIKSAPAILGVGVQLVGLAGLACTIM
ncbi:hypothetical protein FRC04_001604 [Tulasnella sp. 424]|nr:hypothetical protein FRC04_001604 [Tulasnella sp. 424]